ncbi:hypothetical protein Celaphus_00008456 [Cervus elaphus hippelaphus]|uniref:Uncharacterized protein n=1 Tax=Cervus elaphus hippelaphus TaxID=46360 RepID=A0A212CPZ0_CEREH|nr:hypothetical protein Celaphus_00008456 [Cervus elaphus hippelaphus]
MKTPSPTDILCNLACLYTSDRYGEAEYCFPKESSKDLSPVERQVLTCTMTTLRGQQMCKDTTICRYPEGCTTTAS